MEIHAYFAHRYVIAIKATTGRYKIFQIVLSQKDGGIYVAFPYYKQGGGILGQVFLNHSINYPSKLTIGENFASSIHYVKYSHHPSGQAHFSLDGKVKTEIRKQSVPLSKATGHLFTFMAQGIHKFEPVNSKDKGTLKRGFVEFPSDSQPTSAIKFVCHIHSERDLSKIIFRAQSTNAWLTCLTPDGRAVPGVLLATTFHNLGQRKYLILMLESIETINKGEEVFMSFTGGFDSPEIALDHSKDTSFLMFIYPALQGADAIQKYSYCIDL